MAALALYRLPHEDGFTYIEQTEGQPLTLLSCAELNGRSGFVVAPFAASADLPLLLIRPDRVERHCLSDALDLPLTLRQGERTASTRITYAIDFANYHAQLEAGQFQKIVLARCADCERTADAAALDLFRKACERYPRLFVCLVSTPQSGTWLTATPEILLDGSADEWRTIALAGTMKLEGEQLAFDTDSQQGRMPIAWTDKNIQEQRYVATYITECLEQLTRDFSEKGPYTARAGNLVHLRSDFRFTLPGTQPIGDVLQALHPTPAVCGLPKRRAFDFIQNNEHTPRRYYSGFMGPLQLALPWEEPAGEKTHLFVSLRCMEIMAESYRLYAGGGLLTDSEEEQEWQETEAKMETMRSLVIDN